jgi:hypothetical protein
MQTLTSRSSTRRRWAKFLGTGVTALVAATAIASTAAAATTSAPMGATGSVAALSGSTMEVQNASTGQTTVSWTPTTQFSKTVSETVSSLATGDCVSVTGTASKKSKTTITARSITVTSPSSTGSCTGLGARTGTTGGTGAPGGGFGFRGGGSFRGSGGTTSGSRPSFPSGGSGSSNFRKLFASLSIASGKVTAVNGSTITVSGINVSPGSFTRTSNKSSTSKSSKAKKPTLPKTETLKITTSSSTTLSATQTVAANALAVGDCVSAFGPAATNGSVTATTVRITSTGGGTCTGGGAGFFGGGGGGGFAGAGGGGGGGGGGGA